LDQSGLQTARYDLFKPLLEHVRLLKTPLKILGKRGVVRDLLIEAQAGKPAPGQMHAQFFDQFALAGDAIQIANPQDAQQKLGVNRGPSRLAGAVLQLFAHES